MKKNIVFSFLCLLLTVSAGFSQSQDQSEVLKVGDAVRIQIWDLLERNENKGFVSSLNNDYVIDAQGNILMPFVGLIRVAGRSPAEVELLVKKKYQDFMKEPFIFVRPLIRVTITGSVQRPGAYRIDPQRSLWDLFEIAGGPTSDANLEKIRVQRGGRVVIDDLLTAFEKAYSLQEVGIRSGDQIKVPGVKRWNIQTVLSVLNFGMTLVWLYLRLSEGK